MPNCQYIFTNNSKTHTKGETCGSPIRKKGQTFCWKHTQAEQTQLNDIPEKSLVHLLDSSSEKNNFIQLENSKQ
jgi:hypothetical protein